MTWQLTNSLDEFERAAATHLRTDPVRQTLPLSILGSLRHRGQSAFGASPPVFGWHSQPDGVVDGAALQTPPYPLLLASLPAGSARELISLLAAERGLPAAVNIASAGESAFLADWAAVTGGNGAARTRSRLYQLGRLRPPHPSPPGPGRLARDADLDLLVSWHEAFRAEAEGGGGSSDVRSLVTDRLSYGGLMLWEAGGEPVAMAGITRIECGVARVAPVYTAPAQRRRGYGGAVTTAITAAALADGATGVVLFTDLANPTSNALYQRLGYEPVEDRVLIELRAGRDVTTGNGAPSLRS
jgi:ribosomal protein S18 acetylase RimI-like enzyme